MSRSSVLCLDANLVIRYVTSDASERVRRLWRGWLEDRSQLNAPTLIHYDVVNGLYRLARAGLMSQPAVSRALVAAFDIPIDVHGDEALHVRASQLATQHRLAATYDAHYLALAERLGVELWTADSRLVNAVSERLPWVRLVA
jgi:predicted nucleic acid-binding protein